MFQLSAFTVHKEGAELHTCTSRPEREILTPEPYTLNYKSYIAPYEIPYITPLIQKTQNPTPQTSKGHIPGFPPVEASCHLPPLYVSAQIC